MMMRSFSRLTRLAAALLLGVTACSDSTSPGNGDGTRPPEQLNIVRLDQSGPALFNPEASFYAKQGEDRELSISFVDPEGGAGEEYLRLRVQANSLLTRPDGTPFAAGDSVFITVRVVDPAAILFEMEPGGLTFNPAEPAELKIHYLHADQDFNEDGVLNGSDDSIKATLAIWRQENPGEPFVRLGSVNVEELEEINADILGFTRYAIAY
jgi:hypothetical protein